MEKLGPSHFEHLRNGQNVTIADISPTEMMYLIDPYWYQFAPVEPFYFAIIAVTITLLGLMSITGNFIVIYIFTSTRTLRTPSNLFVVNLALSDFMMMFTMFPPVVVNSYYETWSFGPLMCELYGMFGSLFGCVSIYSMTMIACDRYNVIVKGLAGKPLTTGGAVLRILFVWTACGLWAVFPFFGWNRYVPEGNMTACGTDYFTKSWLSRSYIIVYGIWCYFVPLALIVYSYYFILRAVRIHEESMRDQAKKMNVQSLRNSDDKNKNVEIKLAKVALVTILLWFIAWTPYSITNLMGIFEIEGLTPLNTICGSVFAKANAVYNPIVYGLSHPKYQAALNAKLPFFSCKKQSNPNPETKTISTAECESAA